MSTNFASLGISVESSQAAKASDDLDKLVDSAVDAEKAIDELGKTGEGLANTGKKISQTEAEVAQGVEKTTGAIDRQATAGKKRSDSAAYEMTITRQLEAAVAAAAGSRENLSRANELYVKAQERGLLLTEDEIRLEGLLDKAELKVESSRLRQIAAAEKENYQKQKLIESENRRIESLKRTVNGIDPLTKKLADLEARERALNELHKSGEYDALRYNEALAKIGKDRAGLTEAASAFDKLRLGTRQAQENVMQLGNAFSSGDWGSGIRAVTQLGAGAEISAARLLTMAGPIAIAAAAVGGLSYAYYKGHQEQENFNKSLILTGNIAGTSTGQLADMARQVSAVIGTTGQAAEVLASLAGSGKIASGSFVGISEAALAMEKATGKSVDATVAEFVKIAEDPVAAAKSLNEQYHFLTASVYSQIVALQEQGDTVGAAKILTDSYASTIETRAGQITQNLGLIERGWNDIRDAAKKALDVPLSLGREKTLTEQLDSERAKLADLDKKTSGNKIVAGSAAVTEERKQLEESIRLKEAYVEIEKRQSKYVGDRRKIEDDAVDATARADARHLANLSNEGKRALEIKKINEDTAKIRAANPNDKRVDPKYVAEQIKDVNERYKDPKSAGSQVDLTSFNNAKNNLTDIVTDYRNAQKELEAQQKAGVVSLSDYAKQRSALINQEKDDVTAAYQAEIDALEAAKAKKGTTAAQSIQLDQKIADARQGMVKAQKDADSQLTVIATNEKGRVEQLTAASEAYVNQLERQRAALEAAGSRAANGLGLGDRQAALQASLDATTDKFNEERAKLLDRRKTAPDKYSQEDYMRDLASLEDAERKYRDTVVDNYDKMSEAQGDWRSGASSAFQNYLQSANDVAGQTKSLFTNAFSSMEDAVANFAITGKLSFSDFTKSILADMARIATRQAASSIFSSIASAFGGGGASFGSSIGSAITANAKGGVYDSPSLSSFSNQVHDKPQMFAFAKGAGIFAEAGPEAIMPLTRTAGGELGVRALGGGGGEAGGGNTDSKTEITININRDGSGDATADTAMGQKLAPQFLTLIRAEIAANERRTLSPSGGATWRVINGR